MLGVQGRDWKEAESGIELVSLEKQCSGIAANGFDRGQGSEWRDFGITSGRYGNRDPGPNPA